MAAWTTVDFAREGDQSFLIARLRDPSCSLVMEERAYLADLLEGKVEKKPRHRPRSRLKDAHKLQVAGLVIQYQSAGMKREEAIATAANAHNCSVSSVKQYLVFRKKWNKDRPEVAKRDAALVALGKERRRDGTYKSLLSVPRKPRL